MNDAIPYYWKSIDWDRLMADYPPPPMYFETTGRASEDEIRALQEQRLRARLDDAWELPFYERRWRAVGLEPGDVTGIDDLDKIPTFTSDDLKDAIADVPPFGSHHPFTREDLARHVPLKVQTSGGTTGTPRTTVYDTLAWEVQGIQSARALWAAGARPGDVVQIPFTTALGNAPWSAYVGAHYWTGCVPVTSGSGAVTPSERQIKLAVMWQTNGWYAMGEYLARLAEVAEQMGVDLREQLPTKFLHAFVGADTGGHLRRVLEDAWGAPVYDNYGTHEIGLVAFECEHHDGRHVSEDTVYLQTVDVDDPSIVVPQGQPGDLVATSLHRSVPPIIRYNLHDALTIYPREQCECGLVTTKLSTFLGRTDEMVKLRGQNIYPMACQDAVVGDARTTGQFLCVVSHVGEGLSRRETMTVRVERRSPRVDANALRVDMQDALRRDLGARVDVEIVEADALSLLTGLGGEGKVRRLLDLRRSDQQVGGGV